MLREASSGLFRHRPCGAKLDSGRAGLSSPAQALGAGGEAAGQPGRVVDEGIGFSIR